MKFYIDEAAELYNNLLECKSDFICKGISNSLCSYLEGDKLKFYAFCYIYFHQRKQLQSDGCIKLSSKWKNINCRYSSGNEKEGKRGDEFCFLDSKLEFHFLTPFNTDTEVDIAVSLLDIVKKMTISEVNENVKFFSNNLKIKIENNYLDSNKYLLACVKNKQNKDFYKWYFNGIRNLGYKIFNEFSLSFTTAEYLRDDHFSSKLKEIHKSFQRAINDQQWDCEEKTIGNFAPLLIRSVMNMAARYQLFCRQVQSQTQRTPRELHLGLRLDVEAELRNIFPKWESYNFEPDNSTTLVSLFHAFLDIGIIDHRFIFEQQNIEKLIFALETIRSVESQLEISSWNITKDDVENLKNYTKFQGRRIVITKIILKLVYGKACTLITKMRDYVEGLSKSKIFFRDDLLIKNCSRLGKKREIKQ